MSELLAVGSAILGSERLSHPRLSFAAAYPTRGKARVRYFNLGVALTVINAADGTRAWNVAQRLHLPRAEVQWVQRLQDPEVTPAARRV